MMLSYEKITDSSITRWLDEAKYSWIHYGKTKTTVSFKNMCLDNAKYLLFTINKRKKKITVLFNTGTLNIYSP